MNRSRWVTRARTLIATLTLVVVGLGGAASPAQACVRSWQSDVRAATAQQDTSNAQAYLQEAVDALTGEVDDARGLRLLALVEGDLAVYSDGARFTTDAAGRASYDHSQALAAWLQARMARYRGDTTGRVTGLAALLRAGRVSASVAVSDLAGVLALAPARAEGVKAARRALTLARGHLSGARVAMGWAAPSAVVTLHRSAWTVAVGGLDALGIDAASDRDGDGLSDRLELALGSSPFGPDTDGDGLTDVFEFDALFSFSSLLAADTDGDGTRDGSEDLDGDGLDALREQEVGSSPTEPDTDSDTSSDGAEIASGTDPLVADTDVDGLSDGAEPAAGTNPLDSDSDDDGVLDGADLVTGQVTALDGIHVALTGTGDLAGALTVTEVTTDARAAGTGGQVGPAYNFSLSPPMADALLQAELTVPFPAELGTSKPEDLRLFYLDPELGAWQLATEDQSVDVQARVVTATVTHFSTYAIFDITNWGQTWTAQDNPCRARSDGGTDFVLLDLALVLDSSGSMSWNDPEGLRLTAAKSFVDALLPEDRAAVVDFDDGARIAQGLTSDKSAVKAAIDTIDANGGTDIGAGVAAANQVLLGNGDPTRARMMILLTDGVGSYSTSLTTQAAAAGITIYTIGLGTSVDSALLSAIATGTGGTYTNVRTAAELPEVFRRLAEDTGGGADLTKDTDTDGLPDCVEIEGALSGFQHRYTSDPLVPDTDGDGLTDGDEVGDPVPASSLFGPHSPALAPGLTVYRVQSDPAAADTDTDGLVDPAELDLTTSAMDNDTDGDGLTDGVEVDTLGTSPVLADTDADTFSDAYEDTHRTDQGLDPLFVDVKVSAWTYAGDFAKGFLAGDLWREDSLAWLAGNLGSGGLSFIPVYGWIAGGIADLRDVIGSAIHADWVGSGLSALGIIPYAGDAVAIPGKAVRFVARNLDKSDEVLTFVARLDDVPTSVKVGAAQQILKNQWDVLKEAGFTDDALIAIMKGRGNLDQVAKTLGRATAVVAGTGFKATGKAGEAALEATYGATIKGRDRQVWFSTKDFLGRGRFADVFEVSPRIAHESKVGYVSNSISIRNQIRKDARLVNTQAINGARWHFYASAVSNTIGADPKVIDLLVANGIPFTIHIP
ncbi:MAG: VWA domain-containing protein [Rhodoglobus sp.]